MNDVNAGKSDDEESKRGFAKIIFSMNLIECFAASVSSSSVIEISSDRPVGKAKRVGTALVIIIEVGLESGTSFES